MKKEERERERERYHAAEGGSICIREHSGVNQDSGSLDSGVSEHDFSAKNLRIHSRARITRMWRTLVDRGRLRAGSLFAFSPLLTSYSRAYFLRQPSRIVNVNAHFFTR